MQTIRTDEISILDVVSMLWLTTFAKTSDEYWIEENGARTDWRSICVSENFVKDFSGKWRAQWWPFAFVRSFMRLSDADTYVWFEDKFPSVKPKQENWTYKKTVKQVRNELQDLSDTQKEYLKWRWIDYWKVKEFTKNYNWWIACMIHQKNMPVGINARTLSQDHTKRFTALSWYSTAWIYQHNIDRKKKYLYVVEWLIDFLTLRQFETNVIGLKSAESWIDEVIELSKEYEIRIIFDNDDSGTHTKEKLKNIKYKFFNWNSTGEYSGKDINDFYKNIWFDDLIIGYIEWYMIEEVPILSTIDKFRSRQKLIKEQWSLWIKWPYPFFDYTQGIVRKKVYTIGAFSNTGKSKLAYNLASEFLKMWLKVLYVSIEEWEEDMFGNIACAYQNHSLLHLDTIEIKDNNYYNLVLSDTSRKTTDIDIAIKQHKPDIVFIDYVQWLMGKWSSYEKNAEIALSIQTMTIENNITTINLAQLSNSAMKDNITGTNWNIVLLKWAWEYYAASDVIFILARDEQTGQITMKIEKNKLGRRWIMYDVSVAYDRNQFSFKERQEDKNF